MTVQTIRGNEVTSIGQADGSNIGRIGALGTQGVFLTVLLSLLTGFALGHAYKVGRRSST